MYQTILVFIGSFVIKLSLGKSFLALFLITFILVLLILLFSYFLFYFHLIDSNVDIFHLNLEISSRFSWRSEDVSGVRRLPSLPVSATYSAWGWWGFVEGRGRREAGCWASLLCRGRSPAEPSSADRRASRRLRWREMKMEEEALGWTPGGTHHCSGVNIGGGGACSEMSGKREGKCEQRRRRLQNLISRRKKLYLKKRIHPKVGRKFRK